MLVPRGIHNQPSGGTMVTAPARTIGGARPPISRGAGI